MNTDAGVAIDMDAFYVRPLESFGMGDRPDPEQLVRMVFEVLAVVVGDRVEAVARRAGVGVPNQGKWASPRTVETSP